ncbi:hypothetical protein B0H15DRAFT_799186 [Mycena belliarum]|uniref:ACC deaminase n=1 Tax=Mycena belliarum TaxID=1033014 RepID=A0AAD6U7Z8_9AGAR|nr:hypothetical protein B0H15DRAFT_799186 [Mycena belliae]
MTADLGGKVKIWAKREDYALKLEYLLADALAQSCDTLVSIGGVQSNHTCQVAAVAAKYGPKAKLVVGQVGLVEPESVCTSPQRARADGEPLTGDSDGRVLKRGDGVRGDLGDFVFRD